MKQLVPLYYNIYQVNNDKMACNGKWFPRSVNLGTIDTDGVAQHIRDHGSTLSTATIKHVFDEFKDCLLEMLMENKKVKINGLGTFYLALHSSGATSEEDFTADLITRTSINFLPDASKNVDLTSTSIRERIMLKKANFAGKPAADSDEPQEDPEP